EGGRVAEGGIERLGVRDRLAQADVDDDLVQARDLHGIGVAEVALQGRHGLVVVALPQPGVGGRHVAAAALGTAGARRRRGRGSRGRWLARTAPRLLGLVAHRATVSICSPHCLQTRTRVPSSRTWTATRVGLSQRGQTTCTLLTWIGTGRSRMPAVWV